MSKDFSQFLGSKKSKNIDLLGSKNKTSKKGQSSRNKSSSKLVAKYKQSNSKLVAEPVANYKQSSSSNKAPKPKTSSKVIAQLVAEPVANYKQSSSKLVAEVSFQELTGLQRNIVEIIYQSCRRRGDKISSPITIQYLSKILKTSSGTVKNAILRLQNKGVLSKYKFKNGRGGWTQYQLKDRVYQDLLQYESDSKLVANYKQSISKVVAQPVAELVAPSHSSSYNFDLKKNTTTIVDDALSEKCASIEIPAEVLQIGFKESHLKQIFTDSSLSKEDVAESLAHYALDLRNGSVRAGFGKLNLIVGVLKKSNQYVSEAYISEERKVLEELAKRSDKLKELKIKKAEIELLKEYKKWKGKLTQEEINKFAPPSNIIEEGGTLQDIQLQSYFEETLNN